MTGRNPFEPDEGDRTIIGRPAGGAGPTPPPEDDGDRTQIRGPGQSPPAGPSPFDPVPSTPPVGASAAARPTLPGSPFNAAPLSLDTFQAASANPLLAAGAPLIVLANTLRGVTDHPDVVRLRRTIVDELRTFQARARELGVGEEDVRYGHYALSALIDEVILSTPWGTRGSWGKQTLVATFHNEVVSGDRMFEIADALEARPGRSPNLLELIYVCLSFGFEGRMRLERGGASKLVQLRDRLFGAIRNLRGPVERGLSPAWKGVDAAYQPIARQTPLWVWLAGLAALLLALYAGFVLRLASLGDRAVAPLTATYRAGPASLNRSAPAPASDDRLFLTILDILKPDIDAGRVQVSDDPGSVLVRMRDRGLFASGSADLDPGYGETTARIAQAIGLTQGQVPLTGHTDNQRIASLRYPSNQSLSEARAAAVVAALAGAGIPPDRMVPTGVGESQPVADNGDDAGRRQNRRVEIVIPKTYAGQNGR
ncbi:type IVB secretion system protein IcmH/DotU [Sphingomonas montana]|uniref:type IVB secretion system protein IcmH/DotU n=1 Tax=Sphingomonas montana TaxID=1843236 RepID=UPI00096E83C1|nr:type IVB secretion system protein IcmH/DotU [Sphingomonas montana]